MGDEYPIIVTSLLHHALNSNAAIPRYLASALRDLVGPYNVSFHPLELIEAALRSRRPDLVIAVGSLASDRSDLRGLRQAADRIGAQIAYWLHDDPYEFDYSFKVDHLADVVFANDAWAVQHYRHPNVHHLPLAAAPEVHHRALVPTRERDITVFFCGVAYPNRIDLFRRADRLLSAHATVLRGADWPEDIACAVNQRLSPAEMADHAQRAKLTINIGRDLDIANRRFALPASTPGPRTFEIALSGSPQLYFVSSLEILDYFEPKREILLIDGVDDIRRAIERANDEPEALDAVAAAAQRRALAEHGYAHRARRILEICRPEPGAAQETRP